MSELASLLAAEACRNLIHDYAAVLDAQDYARLRELFASDASFARPTDPDTVITGVDAIVNAFESRPRTRLTQHLCANLRIRVESATQATGSSVLMLYLSEAADALVAGKGRKASAPLIGSYEDRFILTADGWRFAARRGKVTLNV